MLVEGGYLHSLKLLVEKAAKTPDPDVPASSEAHDAPAPPRLIERLLRFASRRH